MAQLNFNKVESTVGGLKQFQIQPFLTDSNLDIQFELGVRYGNDESDGHSQEITVLHHALNKLLESSEVNKTTLPELKIVFKDSTLPDYVKSRIDALKDKGISVNIVDNI